VANASQISVYLDALMAWLKYD